VEPNYLAHVEFYEEDFPWRYTPARADGLRVRPWLALVVLEDTGDPATSEFTDAKAVADRPLPFIAVKSYTPFPKADQLWAWAHVHVNRSLAANEGELASTDMGAVLPRLEAVLGESPDLAYSRIVCPRRLAPDTPYHAFLVPVFEPGRLAGLGLDPGTAPRATFSAWEAYENKAEATSLPYYHRWYFRTGTEGDFEYLVRLLEARPADPRVGNRDMDVRRPGSNLPGIEDLGGILRLGGALRVPREALDKKQVEEAERFENWAQPYPHEFQRAMAAFVDLPDDYAARAAAAANAASELGPEVEEDPDPLITSPLYGRWHALTQRLLVDRDGNPLSPDDNWVHELNLDPRHRVAAGFGTRVVQENQEDYMNAAWEQIGDVLEANRRIREAQLAKQVSLRIHEREIAPLAEREPERALTLTAPVQGRVRGSKETIRHKRAQSLLPPVLTSVAMRRATRPRSRLMRGLGLDAEASSGSAGLLERVNAGEVSAAPPKTAPAGAPLVEQIADGLLPSGVPGWVIDALRAAPWLTWLPLLLAILVILLVLLLLPGAWLAIAGVAAAGLAALSRLLARWRAAIRTADALRDEGLTEAAVDALPASPDFRLSRPAEGFAPRLDGTDSAEAVRFKEALRDWHGLHAASLATAAVPQPRPLALAAAVGATVAGIDPRVTVPRRTLHGISLPPRIVDLLDESFQEVMAYPEIDLPMYKPLTDISDELFVPNLGLIEQNSITLLETNQDFIEAYMVGLNHEF
ncbi:MAG TPA: hypothetical protein VIL21_03760, partial [Solirubrobacterales bacterium]